MIGNKTLVASLALLIASTLSLQAQVDVLVGPKLGVQFTTIDSRYIFAEAGNLQRFFSGGGFVRVQPFDQFYFQGEVLVSGKGGYFPEEDTFPAFSETFSYLEFPLIVGFQPSEDFLDVHLGIAFSSLLSAFEEQEGTRTNVKDQLESWDFSILGGIGFEFYPGFGVGARMIYGIKDIRRVPLSNQVFDARWQNFALNFSAWYKIPLVRNSYRR